MARDMLNLDKLSGDGAAPGAAAPLRVTMLLAPATAALLNTAALSQPQLAVQLVAGGIAALLGNPELLRDTDVLVAEIDAAAGIGDIERLIREHPALPIVAAMRGLSVAATRQLLRAGAYDVLAIPFSLDELRAAVEPARHARLAAPVPQQPTPVRRGKVIGMLGALGGVGTTVLAVQAGILWAKTKRTCLIDLDIQFGNAALYLDLKPSLTLADLIDAGDRLDRELLGSVAEIHASGLAVIASPLDMVPLDALTPEFVRRLIDLARGAFEVVLIDLPGAWTSWSLAAIEAADTACLVTSLTVPGIHQARRQLEVIDANGLGERTRIIVNRVPKPMFRRADLGDTEKVLGRRVDFQVTNDYPTVNGAIDQGRAFSAVAPRSRVEKDLSALIDGLATTIGVGA